MGLEVFTAATEYLERRIPVFYPDSWAGEELIRHWQHRRHAEGLLLTSGATGQRYGMAVEFMERGTGGLMVEVRHQPQDMQELEDVLRQLPSGSKRIILAVQGLTKVGFARNRLVLEGQRGDVLGGTTSHVELNLVTGGYLREEIFTTASILIRASS